jgi:DNA-binding response OmpR family regulator
LETIRYKTLPRTQHKKSDINGGKMQNLAGNQYVITLDDDPIVSKIIEKSLSLRSVSFPTITEFTQRIPNMDPLAVFVDIHLANDQSGLDIVPQLRSRWPYSPIIVITADPADDLLVDAFRKGADDFLLKPIKPREVQARFQTRLTHLQDRAAKSALSAGDVSLDTAHRVVTGPNGRQFLAPVETLLLAQLIKAKGTVVPKETLKREAWGPVRVSDNAFYRKLFELRRALEGVSVNVKIQSVYGAGLSLDVQTNVTPMLSAL